MKEYKVQILKLRNKGCSYNKIVKELGCAKSTVSYYCSDSVKIKREEQINKMKEMVEFYKTHSVKETVERFKVSKSILWRYKKQFCPNFRKRKQKIVYKICKHCGEKFKIKYKKRDFCSPKCLNVYKRNVKIEKWLRGKLSGVIGKTGTAKWIKSYLIEKHGEKCMKCGWDERSEYTNKIPIDLDHIDGDFTNNKEENLRLLCPNCHSLTSTYKSLNVNNKKRKRKR